MRADWRLYSWPCSDQCCMVSELDACLVDQAVSSGSDSVTSDQSVWRSVSFVGTVCDWTNCCWTRDLHNLFTGGVVMFNGLQYMDRWLGEGRRACRAICNIARARSSSPVYICIFIYRYIWLQLVWCCMHSRSWISNTVGSQSHLSPPPQGFPHFSTAVDNDSVNAKQWIATCTTIQLGIDWVGD